MILREIIENKRREVAFMQDYAHDTLSQSDRDFLAALRRRHPAVIAELKPASPTAGKLAAHYDPVKRALSYQQGGAAAISVLTDQRYFGGQFNDLALVKRATSLPILCKDFFIDAKQVYAARAAGADACLLILAVLTDAELKPLKQLIESLGMLALLEIHTRAERDRALSLAPQAILINNRDLRDLTLHPGTAETLAMDMPRDITVIAASGYDSTATVRALPSHLQGVLIGTHLMKQADPEIFLRDVYEN